MTVGDLFSQVAPTQFWSASSGIESASVVKTYAPGSDGVLLQETNDGDGPMYILSAGCVPDNASSIDKAAFVQYYIQDASNNTKVREYTQLKGTNVSRFGLVPLPIPEGGTFYIRGKNQDSSADYSFHAQYTVVKP